MTLVDFAVSLMTVALGVGLSVGALLVIIVILRASFALLDWLISDAF